LEQRAVAAAVLPDAGVLQVGARSGEIGGEPVELRGRADLGDVHLRKLLARVAVPFNGGVVHIEEAQSLEIVDPHCLGVVLEEQLEDVWLIFAPPRHAYYCTQWITLCSIQVKKP
jgi:hypothetical protein